MHFSVTCTHWGQTICFQSSEPGLYWGLVLEKATEVFAFLWLPQWPPSFYSGRSRDEPRVFPELDKKWAITLTEFQQSGVLMGERSNPWLQVPLVRAVWHRYGLRESWSRVHRSSGRAKGSSFNETKTHEQSQEQFCASSSVAQSDLWPEPSSTSFWET